MKTAVVLFNLGGPDAKASIRPYLRNFFMDKAIIPAPRPFRDLISWLIARKRARREAGDSYARLGDKSPLLENTKAQADALQAALGPAFKVFISMRYWHPLAKDVAKDVKAYNPDKIVLLPLYPQFSTTTTGSSYEDWNKAAKAAGLDAPSTLACCYPMDDGYVQAATANIRAAYAAMTPKPRVLFSAHGVPLFVLDRGDPYVWQCSATARAIVKELAIEGLDWAECYQSRVGPVKWTEPSVEDELNRAAKDGVPVLIYPHAFVSEHVETLVEIEEEYRHMAVELGVPGFGRVPTVSTHPAFIDGLKETVLDTLSCHTPDLIGGPEGSPLARGCGIRGAGKDGTSLCPKGYKACAKRQYDKAA
jgi:ferrochelatase